MYNFRYGINCQKRCGCFKNQPCDTITGLCKCNPGYRGHRCEYSCPLGYYGNNCSSSCPCKNGASCDGVSMCNTVFVLTHLTEAWDK